jgi:hypothetical protein
MTLAANPSAPAGARLAVRSRRGARRTPFGWPAATFRRRLRPFEAGSGQPRCNVLTDAAYRGMVQSNEFDGGAPAAPFFVARPEAQ